MFQWLRKGYEKLKEKLHFTKNLLGEKLRSLFSEGIDEEKIDEMERLFYEADLGAQTAKELTEKIKKYFIKNPELQVEDLLKLVKQDLLEGLKDSSPSLLFNIKPLEIILIVGVNGNGKTTTIAKLSHLAKNMGMHPMLAAGDTFRAAAQEQLKLWADRLEADIILAEPKQDPAALSYTAVQKALSVSQKKENVVLFIDTAGRLHTRDDLMLELEKIKKVVNKGYPGAPHHTLLVLDATTGQNGLEQAKLFHEKAPLTGIVLTKMDGSSKGGIAFRIQKELKIPIVFIGVGEGIEDLEPFHPESFIDALF